MQVLVVSGVVLLVTSLGFGEYSLFFGHGEKTQNTQVAALNVALPTQENKDVTEKIAGGTLVPTEEAKENITSLRYQNTKYGLTLMLPEDYTVSAFEEFIGGDTSQKATVLVFRNRTNDDLSFQVYVAPFDELGSLTAARVQQDLPDLLVEDPERVVIGGGVEALRFLSENETGKTLEVWFSYNNNLYQVTAERGQDGVVGPILETLKFGNT